ncbi:MAG: type II toxin-antitoxin system HicB family antitoxin [Limisphaerales bacterium]
MILKAIIHDAEEGGFWAEVPALPGCVTQGESIEEVTANLREAIDGWLAVDLPTAGDQQGARVIELAV